MDINPESVEITKLSLWLKTAKKNQTLASLDDNIKCGNSIVSDLAVAGEYAFNWQEELHEKYRNLGIGTAHMGTMLQFLKDKGYKQTSLSVQKANYAVNMYRKMGFEVVKENEEEYIMVCKL